MFIAALELPLVLSYFTDAVGFPGGTGGKESACNAGDMDSVPGWGRSSGGGKGNPLHYFCLENPHGQRSLVGYSPQVCKESYVTGHTQLIK